MSWLRISRTDRAEFDGQLGGCSESRFRGIRLSAWSSDDMKARFANGLVFLLFAVAAVGVRAADIAVVISSDANVYQEALEGLREVVPHRIVSVYEPRRMFGAVMTLVIVSVRLPRSVLYGCR